MVDDEQARQQRDISGDAILFCDRCGQPIDPASAHLIEPEPSELVQPGPETWLCAACWEASQSGQEDLEPEVDLEEIL